MSPLALIPVAVSPHGVPPPPLPSTYARFPLFHMNVKTLLCLGLSIWCLAIPVLLSAGSRVQNLLQNRLPPFQPPAYQDTCLTNSSQPQFQLASSPPPLRGLLKCSAADQEALVLSHCLNL